MTRARALLDRLGLDTTTLPDFLETLGTYDPAAAGPIEPRRYPGYPEWPLPPAATGDRPPLDLALASRRTAHSLAAEFPARPALARLLSLAHGVTGAGGRGPAPSAGSLQALEIFLVGFGGDWLPSGGYHYDRVGHRLAQLRSSAQRDRWLELAPSMGGFGDAPLLVVLAGDCERVERKYGERAARLLLLEAGHLMQNLCLVAPSCGLAVVPFGGLLEAAAARELGLARGDAVLYAGACGVPGVRQKPQGA